jgi:hypothetical protein
LNFHSFLPLPHNPEFDEDFSEWLGEDLELLGCDEVNYDYCFGNPSRIPSRIPSRTPSRRIPSRIPSRTPSRIPSRRIPSRNPSRTPSRNRFDFFFRKFANTINESLNLWRVDSVNIFHCEPSVWLDCPST